MREFARLYTELDQTTKTNAKVDALANYFSTADDASAAWATYFLTGRRLTRLVSTRLLREWAAEVSQLPTWLFEECYQTVGDLAETLALLVPPATTTEELDLCQWVETKLIPLRDLTELDAKASILELWSRTSPSQRFLLNKLITGGLRVGVSQKLVVRSLAKHSGLEVEVLSHRMMGSWEPTAHWFRSLLDPEVEETLISRPYPFLLAHPLDRDLETLGSLKDWILEWKWDGIRAQLVRRRGETFIWSRGEELMEGRFPEIESAMEHLPNGTVLDGELLGFKDQKPLPFSQLQTRINRKNITRRLLEQCPVHFFAFDLLEKEGRDIRQKSLEDRREELSQLLNPVINQAPVSISPRVEASDWMHVERLRQAARDHATEGLMIKHRHSQYGVGRSRNGWWKWKVDPLTIDAVLIYAQRGHGRRASLYSDYTFAVWQNEQLVPFAKAYSGLSDREIREVDRFIRQNTQEKFGPVRSVTPQLVFEIAFEGISESPRHKSGIAVRFPRIHRWRQDKTTTEANSLEDLHHLLAQYDLSSQSRSS
jgi:DNA ligase-1